MNLPDDGKKLVLILTYTEKKNDAAFRQKRYI